VSQKWKFGSGAQDVQGTRLHFYCTLMCLRLILSGETLSLTYHSDRRWEMCIGDRPVGFLCCGLPSSSVGQGSGCRWRKEPEAEAEPPNAQSRRVRHTARRSVRTPKAASLLVCFMFSHSPWGRAKYDIGHLPDYPFDKGLALSDLH
jgi:hypothetical protein